MSKPTNFDIPQSLEVVWTALHEYQDECIPEGGTVRATCPEDSDEVEAMAKENEDLWSNITTSMAWITEALGYDISTADDETNGEYVLRVPSQTEQDIDFLADLARDFVSMLEAEQEGSDDPDSDNAIDIVKINAVLERTGL